uniref:Uncharacterized protein n=1 Tax=Avena sativa TaxID=4498 RepID=A0ACD5XIG5_AVESA
MSEPPTGVPPVPSQEAATMRSPFDGGRGVCSPSAAAATLSTSTATLPAVIASAQESAHPLAAVDTPMSDTYSGSSPMNFLISPVRPFNLLRSLESQENPAENGVHDAAEEDTAIEIKNSRKRSKPGSSTRVGSEETRNVYEQAFMMASQRESGHIFEPIVGTTFDSEVDAIQYYNTYSWEVGFGIRKGKKYANSEKYKTMQTCEGTTPGCVKDSVRKQCKAMVRMKRMSDHGWFFETVVTEHNHELADTVGEKLHWQCHNQIDPFLKDVIRHMRGNNIPLNQVYGVLCDWHGGSDSLPFRKRSLRATCSMIAQEAI